MAGDVKGMVATLAELRDFYEGKAAGSLIELMSQTNDILDDVQFMASNQSDGHLTRVRTGLPEVHWRRMYQGTPYSKSKYSQTKEPCSMMESRMMIDEAEAKLYGSSASKFIDGESIAFMESMRQKAATTFFYGNPDKVVDEFRGLSVRYGSKSSPHVIDAGGTGSACTSAWLVSWGEQTIHGIYPKDSMAGLEHKDLGIQTVEDSSGRHYEAIVHRYQWMLGLALRDWRSVVRIANIPVADLSKRKGETGFIDLQALFIKAKNMMPEHMRQKAIWYGNSEVMTGVELQSTDAGNIHLVYGEAFKSGGTPLLFSRPLRQCDAILSTETALK